MKIGIQTWGSHGDVRPFVALADGLRSDGHDVTLVVTCVDSDRYSNLTTRAGVKVETVATPVIADSLQLRRSGERIIRERNPVKQTQIAIEHFLLPVESELFDAADRLCVENDLVIGHYFLYPVATAAERRSRPYVSVALVHGAVPSAFQPPSGVPNLGTICNRLSWNLARMVLNKGLKKYPDRLRASVGMQPVRDMLDDVWASKDLTLLAISAAICEAKPDWPGHYQVCGLLDTHEPVAEGVVSDAQESFLSNGPAPVYITFGSMISGSDEKQVVRLFTEAAGEAGIRAMIQSPHVEALGFNSTNQIHYLSAAPHSAIFPRCALVVHHGGAGTSQAALRAGKPSVVVAHTAEQELWGRELHRLGAAPAIIPRAKLTAKRLASAMRFVAGSAHLMQNAMKLRQMIAQENGVATAVKIINDRFSA
jgi:sterol 3beta-glucosyltransferase